MSSDNFGRQPGSLLPRPLALRPRLATGLPLATPTNQSAGFSPPLAPGRMSGDLEPELRTSRANPPKKLGRVPATPVPKRPFGRWSVNANRELDPAVLLVARSAESA